MQAVPDNSLARLHQRYENQARWFYGVRSMLLRCADIRHRRAVLDLGCGTGVVTRELCRRCGGRVIALDADRAALAFAPVNFPGAARIVGKAECLPFRDAAFDIIFAQMFFLWVADVPAALREVVRALAPGGWLVAAAEPDYGGRIEHPEAFALRDRIAAGLQAQGADPFVGRKLRGMMLSCGLEVETGLHASLFDRKQLAAQLADEFALAAELGPASADADLSALQNDPALFLFMPYFWFLARKPVQ